MDPHPPLPVERNWTKLAQDREFPVSGVISVFVHVVVLALVLFGVFRMLFENKKREAIEFELVEYADPPGAGNKGTEPTLAYGVPEAKDVASDLMRPSVRLASNTKDVEVPLPEVAPLKLDADADTEPAPRKPKTEIPQLAPLLKGLPTGKAEKGTGGPGNAKGGIGRGTQGDGFGPDRAGTIRQNRRLRWTMLFATRNAADYLNQLKALGVILGVQERDKSIRMIRDLGRRPAVVEQANAPEERIFWMDDNPASVAAMADELQLDSVPWRIVAFFPESIEQQLLQKELAYGKSFGRNSESEIRETKFRIDIRFGQVKIAVAEQH